LSICLRRVYIISLQNAPEGKKSRDFAVKKSAKQVPVPALLITVETEFTKVVLEIVFAFYFVFFNV
jgi:hypothetical protein